jgi:hypothetical protein
MRAAILAVRIRSLLHGNAVLRTRLGCSAAGRGCRKGKNRRDQHERTGRSNSLHVTVLPISWSHVDVRGLPVGKMRIV